MKKEDNAILALPFCMCLGVVIGSILGNVGAGIIYGMLAGVILSSTGLFQKKDNDEDKNAE